MSNILQAVTSVVKSFTDNGPKTPLNISEVRNCWLYLTALQEMISIETIGLNTTSDDELKGILHDAIKLSRSQVSRLEKFMYDEGVPLSPTSPEKPKSDPEAVPLGAKLADDELANLVALKVGLTNIACALGETEAIRNDIGLMWAGFQTEMLTFGSTLKYKLLKRGWMKVPPLYYPPGLPKQ